MRRLALAVSVMLLAGCVDATPVGPDTFCDGPADTVVAGVSWDIVVPKCIERPTITTEVHR